jgi:hypothetical protein
MEEISEKEQCHQTGKGPFFSITDPTSLNPYVLALLLSYLMGISSVGTRELSIYGRH